MTTTTTTVQPLEQAVYEFINGVDSQMTPSDYIRKYGTKSNAIRVLTSQGKTRSEIAKMLNIKYQHVRNVQITPIKKTSVK